MILNLVEAVEVRSPLRTGRYTIFLCADNKCGQRFGVEVSGFHPRIVVEGDFDTLTDIVEQAKVPWGDDSAPQVAVRSLSTQHLCGFQAAGGGVFEVTTDSPSVHQSIRHACQTQQLKVFRELSVEKQMIQSLGVEFGGCFDVESLRPGENPKRMRRGYRSVKVAANEHAPSPIVLYYDIETNNKKTKKFPNAAMGDEVECIGMETSGGDRILLSRFPVFRKMRAPYNNTEVRVFADERKLLLEFAKIVREELQPTYLCAHNGYGFDIIFIFQAARRLGIRKYEQLLCPFPAVCGLAKYRERTRRTNQLGAREVGEMIIPGLVHLDTLLYSYKTFKLSSYSLNSVAGFLKLEMQKDDMKPDELFRAFDCRPRQSSTAIVVNGLAQLHARLSERLPRNLISRIVAFSGSDTGQLWQHAELARLAEYCMVDVALLAKMAKRINLVASVINFGRVTSTSPQEYENIGEQAKCMSLIAHHCKMHNIMIDKERLPTPEQYEGATVLTATPGLYTTPVICCDFMSLYPSIIQAWNISYDTILCRGDQLLEPRHVGLDESQCHKFTLKSNRTVYFAKRQVRHGVLPQIVSNLLARRKAAKELMKKASNETDAMLADCLQKALKVTANALYGFTGVIEHAMLSNTFIAQIITMQGRYLITETSKIAEERFPVKVIYGDTDSVFLLPHDKTSTIASAWELGSIIAKTCTDVFPDPVILEMEKICYPFAQEAKKRYISMVYESPDDHGHFDAKGVDIARRDNAVWHRDFYAEAMREICPAAPFTRTSIIENVIRVIITNLDAIVNDKVKIDKYVITKTIKDESDYAAGRRGEPVNLPQMQAATRFCEQIAKGFPAEPPRPSDRVPYVICAGYSKETHRRAEHIEWVKAKKIPACRLYYLTHLANSLQRFTDATIQDARIQKLFGDAIESVTKSMQQINARRAGNMPLTAFFGKTVRCAVKEDESCKLNKLNAQAKTEVRPAKKTKKNQSLTNFFPMSQDSHSEPRSGTAH